MQIPVDVLLGKKSPENNKSDIREIIFNYLDLCNHCYHEIQADLNAEERQDLSEGDDEIFDDDEWIELDFDLDEE